MTFYTLWLLPLFCFICFYIAVYSPTSELAQSGNYTKGEYLKLTLILLGISLIPIVNIILLGAFIYFFLEETGRLEGIKDWFESEL